MQRVAVWVVSEFGRPTECGIRVPDSSRDEGGLGRDEMLKLEAQTAPEVTVGGNQDHTAPIGGNRHIPLSQQIARVGLNFHMA